MNKSLPRGNMMYLVVGTAVILALVLAVIWSLGMRREDRNWLESVLEKTTRKTQLINTMRVNLLASAEAEKSAVMADTDEASESFAQESKRASSKDGEKLEGAHGLQRIISTRSQNHETGV